MEAGDFRCWPIRLLRRGNALPSRQLSGPMQTPSCVPVPSRPKSVFPQHLSRCATPRLARLGPEPRHVPCDEARAVGGASTRWPASRCSRAARISRTSHCAPQFFEGKRIQKFVYKGHRHGEGRRPGPAMAGASKIVVRGPDHWSGPLLCESHQVSLPGILSHFDAARVVSTVRLDRCDVGRCARFAEMTKATDRRQCSP